MEARALYDVILDQSVMSIEYLPLRIPSQGSIAELDVE